MERINYGYVLEKRFPECEWTRTPGTKAYQYDAYVWGESNSISMPSKTVLDNYWKTDRRETDIWIRFITARDQKLKESDVYVLSDFPHANETSRQAWIDYRSALRDLPDTIVEPICNEQNQLEVTWPVKPT